LVLKEVAGLVMGAAKEWFVKPSPDRYTCVNASQDSMLEQMERQISGAIAEMVGAIAHHDFRRARLYSEREREGRGQLRRILAEDCRGSGEA